MARLAALVIALALGTANAFVRLPSVLPKQIHASSSLSRCHDMRIAASRVGVVRMARKPIVGGNWKCNPATASSLPELVSNFDGCAEHLDKCDVYVCPSNLHVALVKDNFKPGIMVAPQNCNFKVSGSDLGLPGSERWVPPPLPPNLCALPPGRAVAHTRARWP